MEIPIQALCKDCGGFWNRQKSPGELLHLLRQNHTKVCAHHYPALHGLGWLLLTRPGALPVEQATWQVSSQLIIRNYPSFDIHTMHVCLHVAVLIDEESDRGCRYPGKSEEYRIVGTYIRIISQHLFQFPRCHPNFLPIHFSRELLHFLTSGTR